MPTTENNVSSLPDIFQSDALDIFNQFESYKMGTVSSKEMETSSESGAQQKLLTNSQAHFLEEIKVSITVELGALQIDAATLLDLTPEHTLNYEYNPKEAITLKAGNEIVAYAQLVLLKEQLALKITEVPALSATNPDPSNTDNYITLK